MTGVSEFGSTWRQMICMFDRPKARDLLARLIYGFRVSVWFALSLTVVGTAIGAAMGALQGYFGGKVDLLLQRAIEIWGALPEQIGRASCRERVWRYV